MIPLALAAGGDLSIGTADVTFDRSYFLEGQRIQIKATAYNSSSTDLLGSIQIKANGGSVASDQPISVVAGSTDTVFVYWTPSVPGNYNIVVSIVPWESAGDDPSNNSVTKSIYVDQDTDRDGVANSSDEDDDGDGVLDGEDAFPLDGSESIDSDGDSMGDNEDTDDDNDSILDVDDDLPLDPLYSADLDGDGLPDELDDDIDGETLLNEREEDLGTDPLKADTDGDGVDDAKDAFPLDPNESLDTDEDGVGDSSDEDLDGDGVKNDADLSPYNRAPQAEPDRLVYLAGVNDTIVLDATGSNDKENQIVEYSWTFEDGTIMGSQITKSFTETGLHTATLTVKDDAGQTDSVEFKIRVLNYQFLTIAALFALLLIALAFYLIYRYNRRAQAEEGQKAPVKKKKKS